MSGQPYKYYTDVEKFRNEYMETLALQADINEMNLEANKTYKATGQLPAVSQMKDTRTTSEILADAEKLKNDLIKEIAKISSPQFGQLVVQRIMSHPLNSDNKLLVFTAQRIDDIVKNLKNIYKYGIKGDANDAEQFVTFVVTMFNDKNSLTAQTKTFMNTQGASSFTNVGNKVKQLTDILTSLKTSLKITHIFSTELLTKIFQLNNFSSYNNLSDVIANILSKIKINSEIINALQSNIPSNDDSIQLINRLILEEPDFIADVEDVNTCKEFLDFINTSIPLHSTLFTILTQYNKLIKSYEPVIKSTINNLNEDVRNLSNDEIYNKYEKSGLGNSLLNNFYNIIEMLNNIENILLPNPDWDLNKINIISDAIKEVISKYTGQQPQPQEEFQQQQQTYQQQQAPQQQAPQQQEPQQLQIKNMSQQNIDNLQFLLNEIVQIDNELEESDEITKGEYDNIRGIIDELENISEFNFVIPEFNEDDEEGTLNSMLEFLNEVYTVVLSKINEQSPSGSGLKRNKKMSKLHKIIMEKLTRRMPTKKGRGRPKGSGIGARKTFKEIVKANYEPTKGIDEGPRYIKFGKYLINMKKLNNEETLSLKRPSGGNIVEIPSTKLSKNLSAVIKKMVGGSVPTYSDISKLSEPEKHYLHKVSKQSNILDKFDIPAPSKDHLEKDIHQFEVMKGEIMAGNDNKELIKKFKVHIMKLSKNGTLPKREVTEILEDLLELGF